MKRGGPDSTLADTSKLHLGLVLLLGALLGCSSASDPAAGDGLAIMPRSDVECEGNDCGDWPADDQCDDWQVGGEGDQDDCSLDCPRGGPTGPIAVHFDCTEVHVVSCKDLSNVVLAYDDGEHQKFDGLKGHYGTFGGGDRNIATVWVKAGNNGSGDGPGYGERFDSGLDCDGHGGAGGSGGFGGMDGTGGMGGMAGTGGMGGMDGTGGMGGMDGTGGMGGTGCDCDCEPHDDDRCEDACDHGYEGCKYECDHGYEGCKHECDRDYEACKYECDPHDPGCEEACGHHYDGCKDACDDHYDGCKDECDHHYDECKDGCDYHYDECKYECEDEDACEDECDDDDGGHYDGGHHCNCDPKLECPYGGSVGHIEVEFECHAIHASSCKDISNVVLEFYDGEHRKFDDVDSQCITIGVADRVIKGAWVKAGNNGSGDGPGYGERFESDAQCDGMGGSGGMGGMGGSGGTGCDCDCSPHDDDRCKDECDHGYEGCKDECDHGYEGCKHECDRHYEACKYGCHPNDSACKEDCDHDYVSCKDGCDHHYDDCKDGCDDHYGDCKYACDHGEDACKDDCSDDDRDQHCD